MRKLWSDKENEICCEICVQKYVIEKSSISANECVKIIKENPEFSSRTEGSIRNKIQNIKFLLDSWNIPNTIPISIRSHASSQNESILKKVLKENNIKIEQMRGNL